MWQLCACVLNVLLSLPILLYNLAWLSGRGERWPQRRAAVVFGVRLARYVTLALGVKADVGGTSSRFININPSRPHVQLAYKVCGRRCCLAFCKGQTGLARGRRRWQRTSQRGAARALHSPCGTVHCVQLSLSLSNTFGSVAGRGARRAWYRGLPMNSCALAHCCPGPRLAARPLAQVPTAAEEPRFCEPVCAASRHAGVPGWKLRAAVCARLNSGVLRAHG